MDKTRTLKSDNCECIILKELKPKKLSHKELQKKFLKLFKKLEKEKRDSFIYIGKFVE